jgi:hypothetical protein
MTLVFQQAFKLGSQKLLFPFNEGANLTLHLLHLTLFVKHKSTHGSLVVQVFKNFLDPSYNLRFFLCSYFLAISNSILEVELGLDTTHLHPRFREASDTKCKDDAPVIDS